MSENQTMRAYFRLPSGEVGHFLTPLETTRDGIFTAIEWAKDDLSPYETPVLILLQGGKA